MPGLYVRDTGGVNRKFRELHEAQGGVDRKLREMHARDTGGVSRRVFSAGAHLAGTPIKGWESVISGRFPGIDDNYSYCNFGSGGADLRIQTVSEPYDAGNSHAYLGEGYIAWFVPVEFDAVTIKSMKISQNLIAEVQAVWDIKNVNDGGGQFTVGLIDQIPENFYYVSEDAVAKIVTRFNTRGDCNIQSQTASAHAQNNYSRLYVFACLHSESREVAGTGVYRSAYFDMSIPNGAISIVSASSGEIPINF